MSVCNCEIYTAAPTLDFTNYGYYKSHDSERADVMFSSCSLARLMLRVKNPPKEGVKYVRPASPRPPPAICTSRWVVCVISYADEIGILVPFT